MSGNVGLGSNVGIVPSLAVFRGITAPGFPPVVFLQGTSTPLDGGQGFYAVNLTDKSTADNGTSVIVDGGGYRWELISADTASQIVAALSLNGTRPALDPIMGGIATIAAGTTTDLSTVTQAVVNVTGSGVTIASLGTVAAGPIRILVFADINTLDYDATALILPGAANITTAAGDVAGFESLGSGNWRCIWYTEASGGTPGTLPISEGGTGSTTAVAANNALSVKGADIASAATINLASATGNAVDITGSTGPVTSLGTVAAGAQFTLRFASTPTLTYNATSLILPTAANIVAAAGDVARFVSLGSGNWYCASYTRASGLQLGVNTIALGGTGQATAVAAYGAIVSAGADIPSVAGTTDIGAATGAVVNITGTEAITGLGTIAAGVTRFVRFTGAASLTHNGTSLILPGAANITCAANDTALFESLGSGNWVCHYYKRQASAPLAFASAAQVRAQTATDVALTPASLAQKAAFKANKNGVDQTGITDVTYTPVTFGTEVYDVGSAFASNVWTPPAGMIQLGACVRIAGTLSGTTFQCVRFTKNGAALAEYCAVTVDLGSGWLPFTTTDLANGTDAYGVEVYIDVTAGTGTVSGSTSGTFFYGSQI